MRYIMVTDFKGHWDNIPNNSTQYTTDMFKGDMNKDKLASNTETIFIKVESRSNPTIEKCWKGYVYDFTEKNNKKGQKVVSFRVKIQEQIDCPEKYSKYDIGWWSDEKELNLEGGNSILDPRFFSIIDFTENWAEFEKYSYYLLKCIGLHALYKFPLREQKGKADGFFIFGKLVVMFDMTLERGFEKSKEIQIENFCSQLKKSYIQYGNQKFTITNHAKQVWIITRGANSRLIKKEDEILIKEVPVTKIEALYRKRLIDDIDEEGFERCLRDLGSS